MSEREDTAVESRILERDLFDHAVRPPKRGPLAERFLVPPFSVLNAREGAWQERKRAWLALGIQSEIGREVIGPACTSGKNSHMFGGGGQETSIFDPVMCELAYRWFCPKNGQIVDPFAGGSVRGIVASIMGRNYWGCDLQQKQVEANQEQAKTLLDNNRPTWICGDARVALLDAPAADFVFSCPPYGDLEVYSSSSDDLSNMTWSDFCNAYRDIILKSARLLKNDRFGCFVVGDFRDRKTGYYRNFPATTIAAWLEAGTNLHNDIVLITSVGSLPTRTQKPFEVNRKLGKTHQNCFVFCKGDMRKAAAACEPTPSY